MCGFEILSRNKGTPTSALTYYSPFKKVPLSHVESLLSLPDMKEQFFHTPRAVSDDFEHHQCNGFARAQRKLCMSPGGMYGLLTEGSSWIPGNSVQDCMMINKMFGSSPPFPHTYSNPQILQSPKIGDPNIDPNTL